MDDFEKKTTSLQFSLKLVGLLLLVIGLIAAGLSATSIPGLDFLSRWYLNSMGVGLISFLVGLILLIPKKQRGIGKSLILAGIMAVVLANVGCMAIVSFARKAASEAVVN